MQTVQGTQQPLSLNLNFILQSLFSPSSANRLLSFFFGFDLIYTYMHPGTPRGEHTVNANITACHDADLVGTRRVSLLSAARLAIG